MVKLRPKRVISSDGKAVLITGCDSGFGNRLAHRLCDMGFRVYATVLSPTTAGALELIKNPSFFNRLIVMQMDVTNDNEVNEIYEIVKKDLVCSGHELWALVNNAGITTTSLLEWGTLHAYPQIFDVYVFGTVRVTRVFSSLIKASKGRITNMAIFTGRESSNQSIYNMAKYSLSAFTDSLRRELKQFRVNVSSIEPRLFRTPLTLPKHLVQQMEKCWFQSTDEVKEAYGSPEKVKKILMATIDLLTLDERIDIVVDDIIDSIVNCRPKLVYRTIGCSYKLSLYLDMFVPSLLDWISIMWEKVLLINS